MFLKVIAKFTIHSRIEFFFILNIAKNLQPGSHFGHLNKDVFPKKIGAV